MPASSRHALVAKDHRNIVPPYLSQRRFSVTGHEHLVIVPEEALKGLEDGNFGVQN